MDHPHLLPGDLNFQLQLKADHPGRIIIHGEEVSGLLIDLYWGDMPQLPFDGKSVQCLGSKLTLAPVE